MESQITILLIYSDRGCPSPDKCRHLCVGEWGKVSVPDRGCPSLDWEVSQSGGLIVSVPDRGCPSPDPSFITPCLTRSKNAKIQNLSPIHMFLRLFTEVLNVLYDKRMSHFINALLSCFRLYSSGA